MRVKNRESLRPMSFGVDVRLYGCGGGCGGGGLYGDGYGCGDGYGDGDGNGNDYGDGYCNGDGDYFVNSGSGNGSGGIL